MGDPRAMGAQIRMRLPSLTPLGGIAAVLEAQQPVRRNGARTSCADSAVARGADVVLCSRAKKSSQPRENATARIARPNLPEAPVVAVAKRDRRCQSQPHEARGAIETQDLTQ